MQKQKHEVERYSSWGSLPLNDQQEGQRRRRDCNGVLHFVTLKLYGERYWKLLENWLTRSKQKIFDDGPIVRCISGYGRAIILG